jgi:KipI family sensor histidine kinase inhibitor
MSGIRFLPSGDSALLAELADLGQTLALFRALAEKPVRGIEEVIPAARTLLVVFQPGVVSAEHVAGHLSQLHRAHVAAGDSHAPAREGRLVEIPVHYNGEDLEEVAARTGLSVAQVIEWHTSTEYMAAFAGFAPGFVYLASAQGGMQVPRRASPRTRVPAGSVALAGEFSAVYPTDSPGGWQLIGVTPWRMWDMRRAEPALLQPGFRVRFRDVARGEVAISLPADLSAAVAETVTDGAQPASAKGDAQLLVLGTGLQTLVQDLGRPGKTALGVSASGALDRQSLREANRAVGNPSDAAVLENLLGQLRVRSDGAMVVAVTGADVPLYILTAAGHRVDAALGEPFALEEGDVLQVGAPRTGLRSYLSVRGGLGVTPVLGSCATDTLAALGPSPLRVGDVLEVGRAIEPAQLRAVQPVAAPRRALPGAGETVVLDVTLGPRTEWFQPEAIALLQSQEWRVTEQSNRVGIRLAGEAPLVRSIHAELPSEGTVVGAIQVPANGQPVLFLADHPLTGGYPVIAVVATHHLDLAAQIPPGARLRLRATAAFAPVVAAQADAPAAASAA